MQGNIAMALKNIRYTDALFVFPAAVIVSHAHGILYNGIDFNKIVFLFIMLSFLFLEAATTNLWLEAEIISETNNYSVPWRRWMLNVVDLLRIFILFIIYMLLIYNFNGKLLSEQNSIDGTLHGNRGYLLLLMGVFLILNAMWNRILTPDEHVLSAAEDNMNKLMADHAAIKSVGALLLKALHVAIFVAARKAQKVFFQIFFPTLGFVLITVYFAFFLGWIKVVPYSEFLVSAYEYFEYRAACFIAAMLFIQVILKSIQFFFLPIYISNKPEGSA